MLDIDKILKSVAKLKRIEPESELEKAVIDSIINSHMVTIYQAKITDANNKIKNYDITEYYEMKDSLEQKLKVIFSVEDMKFEKDSFEKGIVTSIKQVKAVKNFLEIKRSRCPLLILFMILLLMKKNLVI